MRFNSHCARRRMFGRHQQHHGRHPAAFRGDDRFKSCHLTRSRHQPGHDADSSCESPRRLAMTPNGRKAYVSNSLSGTVSVIDTVNRVVTATISTLHASPQELTVTPDGGRV